MGCFISSKMSEKCSRQIIFNTLLWCTLSTCVRVCALQYVYFRTVDVCFTVNVVDQNKSDHFQTLSSNLYICLKSPKSFHVEYKILITCMTQCDTMQYDMIQYDLIQFHTTTTRYVTIQYETL